MRSLFDEFDVVKPKRNCDTTEDSKANYTRFYLELLKKYRSEIEFIDELHRKQREEERKFYNEDLHNIRNTMEKDKVKQEIIEEWLNDLQDSMKKSFNVTEKLISTFTVKTLEEFKREAETKAGIV